MPLASEHPRHPDSAMPAALSAWSLRNALTVGLALCVAVATSSFALERHGSSRLAFGERVRAAALSGVLAHAGSRGGLRTAAHGRGAAGSIHSAVTGVHALASASAVRSSRLQRIAARDVGEHAVPREPNRRSRPVDAAPHRSRVSSAATPRAPPRV